ncbi:dihydrolipoyl dehydrogenase family protein [Pediococcus inopinatus]|uniref:dihydrolipoyl dehydrogenase family protein n=1 Tax=Pediococcus TaxID=1253 RepID=UPI00070E4CE6|nr:NAD(P)/FAD-dependent oxidoreductase [Pediococcus inopinatus]AVK99562.1 glutathione reductase [Pediococcus inopinatus]KRN63772.1 glutathione reductase [Pediococcus inopinatus]WPC18649.1 NAD(P)/FAD-dependent oxidoreductase [Pediococcus inopinatus]
MFDVLFIGSGQGAWNGAIPMSKAGLKVAVVEEGLFGGVCSNRGCNAKITLDKPVELVRTIEQLQGRGFDSVPKINWPDLMAHKHEVIGKLAESNKQKLIDAGVKVIVGRGTLVDAKTVQVGDKNYQAKKIVLVLGQHPHRLDIPGKEYLHDSTDFLSISQMPKQLTIIGAGYVGMEFASIANAVGASVNVILNSHTPLRGFYQPYVQRLVENLRGRGVKFFYDQELTKVVKTESGFKLHGPNQFELTSDYIVDASGRIPSLTNTGLEEVGITTNKNGIEVDDHMQTNVPGIYATGDVVDKIQPKITPTAIFESQYLAQLFTGETTDAINYPTIATTVFSSPRISQVGINPDVAVKSPDKYTIEHFEYADDWFKQVQNEIDGGLTLVFDQNHILVGAVEYSNEAVDAINGLLDIIELRLTHEQVQRFIYTFPSVQHSYFRKI